MTLKGDTLIRIQKWWHAILFPFCQYLSTNKTWLSYKYLRAEHHNIYFFLFPPSTHSKFSTSKENYETLSRALRVYLVKYNTIFSEKAPKWHVKIITYMNNDNRFDLIIAVVFAIIPQIGGLGPKAKYLVISFFLNEGETLLKLNRIDLQIRSEIFLLKDETGHINNLTGKYIMKLSKLKHIQRYMTTFELYCINFECLPKIQQLSTIFNSTIEELFETLETVFVDMSTAHSIVEPIFGRDFGNTFQHQNGPNKCQRIHKNTIQQYQPISYQRPSTSSIPYLKE